MSSAGQEWRQGWPVVAGSLGGMMTAGAASSVAGLVMAPLSTEFGWSRAAISGSVLIVSLCALLGAPVCGKAIAHFGTRRVALASIAATALGFALIGLSGPALWTWFAAWIAFGLLSAAIGPITWSSAVSALFDRSRGLALSVALSGSGLAYGVLPPLASRLVGEFGWRGVYFGLAAMALLIVLPLNWLALRDSRPAAATGPASPAAGMTFGQATRSRRFWQIATAMMLVAGVNGSLLIHFFPMLQERGIAAKDAALLTAYIGPALIAGRLLTGYLVDRLFAPAVAAGAAALPVVTCLILWLDTSALALPVAAVAIGASAGSAGSNLAYLVGRYFGLRDYATIFGVLVAAFGVAFGLAPVITGHVFDLLRDYRTLYPVFLLLLAPAAVLIGTLGRFPAFDAAAR